MNHISITQISRSPNKREPAHQLMGFETVRRVQPIQTRIQHFYLQIHGQIYSLQQPFVNKSSLAGNLSNVDCWVASKKVAKINLIQVCFVFYLFGKGWVKQTSYTRKLHISPRIEPLEPNADSEGTLSVNQKREVTASSITLRSPLPPEHQVQ